MRNGIIPYRPDLKYKARKLRKESTYSEVLLWREIKNKQLGYQFHRQVPALDYIIDFYCHELMLAIEVDGQWHDSTLAQAYDEHASLSPLKGRSMSARLSVVITIIITK